MLLSFMEGPEGRQHYGTEIQGMIGQNRLPIKRLLPPRSSICCIILNFP